MFSNVNSIEKFEKVKLPQIETISRFYQPRKNRKAIRILTVAIYVLCVSLAAIMLSLYYIFLWDPTLKPNLSKSINCEKIQIPEQIAIRLINSTETTADQFYKNLLQHYRIRQKNFQQRRKYHQRQMRVRINNNNNYNSNNYKLTSVQPQLQRIVNKTNNTNIKLITTDTIIPSTIMIGKASNSTTIYPIITNFQKFSNIINGHQRDDEDDYIEQNLESSGARALNKINMY